MSELKTFLYDIMNVAGTYLWYVTYTIKDFLNNGIYERIKKWRIVLWRFRE
jgi:hypothetical protein